ncbi:MAG: hypothetical protein K9I68_01095 [Bacteroidales bacterium]|nr:hypothetical protein [Bacteroidales bacterium]MCF8338579.1 hypothetical protein [Bacteroidales bacterium]
MPKRKKTKYRKITFKLTDRQRKSLEAYCRAINTTPVMFIKDSIRHALNGQHPPDQGKNQSGISSKQIDLEELIQQISEEENVPYQKRDNNSSGENDSLG